MLYYTGLLFLVIAVSLDGFGVGITYGMRGIRVPMFALLIIMFCSGMIVLLSMTIGSLFSNLISPDEAKILGGLILIFLGCFSFKQSIKQKRVTTRIKRSEQINKSNLFLFKTILVRPLQADLDQSGTISTSEAFFLGSALALDAFGAGIGASMLGYSPLLMTFLIAMMSGGFLFFGIKTGLLLSKSKPLRNLNLLPACLLISLGLINILI